MMTKSDFSKVPGSWEEKSLDGDKVQVTFSVTNGTNFCVLAQYKGGGYTPEHGAILDSAHEISGDGYQVSREQTREQTLWANGQRMDRYVLTIDKSKIDKLAIQLGSEHTDHCGRKCYTKSAKVIVDPKEVAPKVEQIPVKPVEQKPAEGTKPNPYEDPKPFSPPIPPAPVSPPGAGKPEDKPAVKPTPLPQETKPTQPPAEPEPEPEKPDVMPKPVEDMPKLPAAVQPPATPGSPAQINPPAKPEISNRPLDGHLDHKDNKEIKDEIIKENIVGNLVHLRNDWQNETPEVTIHSSHSGRYASGRQYVLDGDNIYYNSKPDEKKIFGSLYDNKDYLRTSDGKFHEVTQIPVDKNFGLYAGPGKDEYFDKRGGKLKVFQRAEKTILRTGDPNVPYLLIEKGRKGDSWAVSCDKNGQTESGFVKGLQEEGSKHGLNVTYLIGYGRGIRGGHQVSKGDQVLLNINGLEVDKDGEYKIAWGESGKGSAKEFFDAARNNVVWSWVEDHQGGKSTLEFSVIKPEFDYLKHNLENSQAPDQNHVDTIAQCLKIRYQGTKDREILNQAIAFLEKTTAKGRSEDEQQKALAENKKLLEELKKAEATK